MVNRLDPRDIIRGSDGILLFEGRRLVTVNEWNGQINVNSDDYQPAGQKLVVGLIQGYSVTLTFVETVVEDITLLRRLLRYITEDRERLDFDFLSSIDGRSSDQKLAFRNCEPNGTIDLVGITAGQISRRNWSFRCNRPPDLIKPLQR